MHTQDGRTVTGRAEMAVVGGVAGFAIWALVDVLPDVVSHPHLLLAIASFVAGFFAVLLGLSGPYRVLRAALPALWLSAVAAGFLTLAGYRFETLGDMADAQHPFVAWGIFLSIGTPFAAALLRDHHSLRDYGHLFDVSWSILVRYSAGWVFVGLFWAVLFLSNALLEIVGLTIIEDVIRQDAAPYVITGLALGLGLSVVHEMRDYLSPYLVLRLLRLLVPVVLVVVLVFVAAALMQDPGALFGNLSRAATLLVVGLAMISLVSISLDRGDADAVRSPLMRGATATLAGLLPVIAALAVYALWLRVSQYGWTPARLAASTVAAVVGLYALTYGMALVAWRRWMAHVRQANILVAVVVLASAAAWQTPLLNAERISTHSQVARIEAGDVALDDMALFEMAQEWGTPGLAGIARLQAGVAKESDALNTRLTAALDTGQRWRFEKEFADDRPLKLAESIVDHLTVIPEGGEVQAEMLLGLTDYRLRDWARQCRRETEVGCVLVLGDFAPEREAQQGVLFIPARMPNFDAFGVLLDSSILAMGDNLTPVGGKEVTLTQIRSILQGHFEIAPSSRKSLWIDGVELVTEF